MIHECIEKLIDNIPITMKNETPVRLDIVLDGGVFNGSYLAGALCFLKEMEKKNLVQVERISGVSIGSFIAFLYVIDALDMIIPLYNIVSNEIKTNHNLNIITKIKTLLEGKISSNVCDLVQKRLYISYYNLHKCKKIVKNKYKNIDDVLQAIIKSCFIPFVIDGNLLYKNKYIDGINPYFFKAIKHKKILYLDLWGYDKVFNIFNIKNEKSNYHRVLSGSLDIHNFYIKQSSTSMCSYVDDWTIINKITYNIKLLIEKLIVYLLYIIINIKQLLPFSIKSTIFSKIISITSFDIFTICLDHYCL
jgi:hypothetical protein